MKEKGKFSRALKIEFNYKTNKLKRANSLRPNKIIHINKFRLPMDNINIELKDINKILKTENAKNVKNKGKELIKRTNMKIAKENLIVSLRKELRFQKLLNKNLLRLKEYADKNSNEYKSNYENICRYRNQIHDDLSGFVSIIGNYEKDITNYKNDRELMIKTNESLINYKTEEQIKMKSKLEQLNNDTEKQNEQLNKLRNIIREYRNENEEYYNNMEKNELKHLQKYESLISEYKRLKNLYQYYFDIEVKNMKIKLQGMNKNICSEEEDMAMLKLKEKQVMGEFLRNIIRDINTQINEIEKVNKKMNESKNMEKLLGKKGLEKYRQRMNEKFKSEISTLTTRYNMTFTSN